MSICRTCHNETLSGRRICPSCLSKWSDMRTLIFNTLTDVYGKMTQSNHPTFIKETKRLERIWRKDKEKFEIEINKIKTK